MRAHATRLRRLSAAPCGGPREPERVQQRLVHERVDRLRAEPLRQSREPGEKHVPGGASDPFGLLGVPEVPSLVLLVVPLELRVALRDLLDRHSPPDLAPELEASPASPPRSAAASRTGHSSGSARRRTTTGRTGSPRSRSRTGRGCGSSGGSRACRRHCRSLPRRSSTGSGRCRRSASEPRGRTRRSHRARRRPRARRRSGRGPARAIASCPRGTRSRCRGRRSGCGRRPDRAAGSRGDTVTRARHRKILAAHR